MHVTIQYRTIDSPVGLLTLAGRDGRLTHLRMVDQTYEPSRDGWEPDDAAFPDAVEQLEAYFAGELPTSTSSWTCVGTDVPARVWAGAADDPVRRDAVLRTRSRRRSARPARPARSDLANGHNPIGIIVPCHRVIGANGSLTGYGGGLDRKRALLALEKHRKPGRIDTVRLSFMHLRNAKSTPNDCVGGDFNVCSAVSYFSTRVG